MGSLEPIPIVFIQGYVYQNQLYSRSVPFRDLYKNSNPQIPVSILHSLFTITATNKFYIPWFQSSPYLLIILCTRFHPKLWELKYCTSCSNSKISLQSDIILCSHSLNGWVLYLESPQVFQLSGQLAANGLRTFLTNDDYMAY